MVNFSKEISVVDGASLFDVDDAEDVPSGGYIVAGLSASRGEFGLNPADDLDPSEWFSVCVLTVPDVDRFPIPKRFTEDKQPADLSGLDELSWGDVRKLIQPSLPDDQLAEVAERERNRPKPRAKVLETIAAEQAARGDGFQQWVLATGRNPLMCRIAALAYQVGNRGECISFSIESLQHERAVLDELHSAWHGFERRSGFDRVAGWDIDFTMRVLSARRVALLIYSERQDFRPCLPISGGRWAEYAAAAGGLDVAAVALGVVGHEIPEIAGPMDVWRSWRSGPGLVQLSDWVAGQLQLERELLTVTQGLW